MTSIPAIDPVRLKALMDGINAFGRCAETGGYNRVGFSAQDMAARRWLARRMETEGLAVRWDGAGNLFGRWGEHGVPCIMAGSHTDTVPEGGAFDGTLGVCVALECVLALKQASFRPATPIEIVDTSEEEGRFGGMLGSQAITGRVDEAWLQSASDADGVMLTAAMREAGFDPREVPASSWRRGSIKAFLELHVEQGPVLEKAGLAVGIADSVSGVCNWQVNLEGAANHSGTTPMDMRADAFAGLAAFATGIPDIAKAYGSRDARVTIGKVDLSPNHPHTIPGRASFSLIVRDTSEAFMTALCDALRAALEKAALERRLGLRIEEKSWLPPTALDPSLTATIGAEAERLAIAHRLMPSGAGHDAQTMQGFCPSALVFVPSHDGISHAPSEWTEWDHITAAAALMLAVLQRLASTRDAL